MTKTGNFEFINSEILKLCINGQFLGMFLERLSLLPKKEVCPELKFKLFLEVDSRSFQIILCSF